MSHIYRFMLLVIFVLTTNACSLTRATPPPTAIIVPPANIPAVNPTTAPLQPPVPTDIIEPSEEPAATEAGSPTPATPTATVNAALAQQTQILATAFARVGPATQPSDFLTLYSDPSGTPLDSWHDVPIMKEATDGQEFQADIYSYKADATLQQATDFYIAQSHSHGWSCFAPTTGSSGTGDQTHHQVKFVCGPLTILISSLDSDPNHVLVVINKAP